MAGKFSGGKKQLKNIEGRNNSIVDKELVLHIADLCLNPGLQMFPTAHEE